MSITASAAEIRAQLASSSNSRSLVPLYAKMCSLWTDIAQQTPTLRPGGPLSRSSLATAPLLAVVTDPTFLQALSDAYGRLVPASVAAADRLASETATLLQELPSHPPTRAARATTLTEAATAIGSVQGQVCTLHDLLRSKALRTPGSFGGLRGKLSAATLLGALVGAAVDPGYPGAVENLRDSGTAIVDVLEVAAAGAVDVGRDLGRGLQRAADAALDLPPIPHTGYQHDL